MPIEIKEYTCHESDSSVFITLSLNGVYKYKMDLFYSPEYLKVSYPPYFFEAFLPAKIWTDLSLDDLKEMEGKKEDAIDTLCEDNGIKCLIEDNKIFLELSKLKHEIWNDLSLGITKDIKKNRRQYAVEWRHKYEELLNRKKVRAMRARDRQAISDSIDQDEIARNKLQEKKEQIKSNFFVVDDNKNNSHEDSDKRLDAGPHISSSNTNIKSEIVKPDANKGYGINKDIVKKSKYSIVLATRVAQEAERLRDIPPPRNCFDIISDSSTQMSNIITTTFTPKATKAPLREDRDDEAARNEKEWKKKEYQQKHNLSNDKNADDNLKEEDNSPSDSNCQHLLQKGDQFFKNEDFASALEVFTHGIEKVNSLFAPFHNNRGAVNLRVGNYRGAITDCSTALQLLVPKCSSNELQRAKAHMRIGTGMIKDFDNVIQVQKYGIKFRNHFLVKI